ncbi:putative importin subunit beta-4 [Tolypocladium ophioglossoides CBS 100239]|uniref:Putative importin subunit beta-4 n=1 Tax=Tolypocladium ophioglossoides (strain CBS 100239) TaxID=1163406 RepID=A0A0L0N4E5_TOLOC|nr:putative importin subunit beta-4 [Tolypocladium ophioglossoides CBS 100239]
MDKDKLAQLLQASQVRKSLPSPALVVRDEASLRHATTPLHRKDFSLTCRQSAANTEQVKAVTADLQKNYYSQPESLILLIEIALTHGDGAVRQLAAVQALRLVPKHWERTPQDQKPLARSHLLDGALKETSSNTRHSLARLVAGIVGVDMEQGDGDDFLKQLMPLNNSDNVVAREVGSYILFSMLEDDPTHFSDHTHQLLQLFQARIEDPESKEVRINIVQAIGAILMIVEPEEDPQALKAMQGFLPSMVNIMKATVEAGDEESYKTVFEVFHSFLAYDSALLSVHLRDLLQFMIDLASNEEAEDDARTQALGFLIQCVRYRRMKIQAMKDMGAQLMIKAMHIVTTLDTDEDEEDMTPSRTAISLIDTLSNELPPRQVVVPLLDQFPSFATHQNPGFRMAAMLALGNAAEGAPDFISTQLQPLLPTIINLLCDSEGRVRHAALVGLIHLAEEMADEMASHHEQIISAVLKNLEAASQGPSDKKNVSIIRCACGALDTFGDGIDTKIMGQYGPSLIGPMVKLLDHEDYGVKAAAASAIGAIASSMEKTFEPYFEGVMKALGKFVMIKDNDEAMDLRSSTCDSLGRIAMAVGPELFQPYVMDLMKAREEALHLDNPRLKETSFILWSNLSKVYHEQFDHFLEGVFKGIFSSLELEEEEIDLPGIDPSQLGDGAVVVGGKRVKVKVPDNQDDLIIATSGEDEWDDLEDLDDLGAVTAIALEQEIALDVLGDVISNSCNSSNLETYAEQAIEKVVPFAEHTYEGCRKTAISTLWRTYARVFQVWEESAGVKWQPGMPPNPTPPPSIIKIGQALYKATMSIWSDDSERSVITDINRNVAATLKACGPALLVAKDGMLQELVSVVSLIITRSHPCQQDLGDEEEEQEVDEGSSEFDWLVIDTALDVVVGLSAALGPAFGELWKIFEKPVLRLASSTEDLHRSAAVGIIAEISKYTAEGISPYTESLGQALARRLSDPDPLTKSNAAYAMGLLILHSTETSKTVPLYPQLWEKLEPLLSMNEMRMTDNVSGCLCRMIMKHPDGGFVSEVLPAVVNALPLTEDYEENEPIYQCIYKLYEQGNETVQQLTPQLVGIFEKVLGPPEEQLEQDTREVLHRTVQMLYKAKPDLLSNNPGLLQLAGAQ